nr:MAG TPA: hypothetical protein [Caudoviricetes sp.]
MLSIASAPFKANHATLTSVSGSFKALPKLLTPEAS